MGHITRGLVCIAAALVPLSASGQTIDPRTGLDLAIQTAHCMTYYEVAESSKGMDSMDKDIAQMGRSILDLSLSIAQLDGSLPPNASELISSISAALKPHVEVIPGEQLYDLYNDYCNEVAERFE